MTDKELENTFIEVISGVSLFTRKPFCTIVIDGKPSGQMDPNEVRTMALGWLEAAEAAEMDAMVMAEMTDENGLGLPIEVAGEFIKSLRNRRSLT